LPPRRPKLPEKSTIPSLTADIYCSNFSDSDFLIVSAPAAEFTKLENSVGKV
jgi:hypothetical protein